MTIAFQIITGINPYRSVDPEKSTMRRMETILKRRPHSGSKVQDSDALVRFRFAEGPEVEGGPNFPLWRRYTAVWMRARNNNQAAE